MVGCRIIYIDAHIEAKKFWEKLDFQMIEEKGNDQLKMVFDINVD